MVTSHNSPRQIPAGSVSDELTLSTGAKVRVKVLGALRKADAMQRSFEDALVATDEYQPGGKKRDWLTDQASRMERAEKVRQLLGRYAADPQRTLDAEDRAWDPLQPHPEDGQDDAAFAEAMVAWRQACAEKAAERERLVAQAVAAEEARLNGLTDAALSEEMLRAMFALRWESAYGMAAQVNTLWAACIGPNGQPAWETADAIRDLSEADLAQLVGAYAKLDSVRSEDIPTSPAGSG